MNKFERQTNLGLRWLRRPPRPGLGSLTSSLVILWMLVGCGSGQSAADPAEEPAPAGESMPRLVDSRANPPVELPAPGLPELPETEAESLPLILALRPGMRVADVGAGDGEWTEILAEAVGPSGLVYATEVTEDDLGDLRRLANDLAAVRGQDDNRAPIEVVEGTALDTGLPEACCDAILLRLVYHHFTDPAPMRASLARALRPGALLAVIDMVPQEHLRSLEGVPDRGGHGIALTDLMQEMTTDGFEVVARYPSWPGDEDHFGVVFRRSSSAAPQ